MTNEHDEPGTAAGAPTGPVLFYTETLLEHFRNPRNVGELAEPTPTGSVWWETPPAATR